jgi:SPP1 family predicted phage head-tail adaptor
MTVLTLFRHRLKIEDPSYSLDDTGGQLEVWTETDEVWGEVRGLSGRERVYANAFESDVSHKITLRQPAPLSPKSRLKHNDDVYDVVAVYDPDGQDRVLVCECISRSR